MYKEISKRKTNKNKINLTKENKYLKYNETKNKVKQNLATMKSLS